MEDFLELYIWPLILIALITILLMVIRRLNVPRQKKENQLLEKKQNLKNRTAPFIKIHTSIGESDPKKSTKENINELQEKIESFRI